MTGAKTFYVPEDESNPQNITHTHKLASKLKLRMNHRTQFLYTNLWSLNHRHTQSPLKPDWLWSLGYNDEYRLKM